MVINESRGTSVLGCPAVALEKDEQGLFLENLDDHPFAIEGVFQQALGQSSTFYGTSTPNIPNVFKPKDIYRINFATLGYTTTISYVVKINIRDFKENVVYVRSYEVRADVDKNFSLFNEKVVYKGCYRI